MATTEFDLDALVKEAGEMLDKAIKQEQDKMEALKKSEEMNKKEDKPMEPKMDNQPEPMKKDDAGSGFESPTPEASSPAPSESSPSPSQESPESLDQMVKGLDDGMLHELMQVIQMELSSRKPQESAPAASPSAPPPPSSPSPSPEMDKMEMYKKEVEDLKTRLAKSEQESKSTQDAFNTITDLFTKIVRKPVSKAVTDIRNVSFIDKGEQDLKKNEDGNISNEDLAKKMADLSKDGKKMSALNKNEREVLSNWFVKKQRTPEVLQLVNK